MSQSRRTAATEPVIDDYPVRPSPVKQEQAKKLKGQYRTLVLFSLIYFLYGNGISIYGPLYPIQARIIGLNSYIYGSVIASSHFVCVLAYPVACRIISSVSCRNSLSISIFMLGACRILLGTVSLIAETSSFIAISFAVQAVEGLGISLLIASTVATACARAKGEIRNIFYAIEASLCLGFVLGPIFGEVLKEELDFSLPFYIIGGLTLMTFILIATMLPEPEQQVTYADIPIIYWLKNSRMVIYFFIVFGTFNYVGFLSVSLQLLLKQFHLNFLYTGFMFSISPFAYGLTVHGFAWIIRKGCNNVLLVFIGSIAIFASLVILGPAPFISLEGSLTYVCWALVLEGLGIACKSACVMDAAAKDLRYQKKYSEIQQQLIVPTIFMLAASLGYFSGALTAGFTNFYIGYRKATLPLFGLEICIAIAAIIFAFKRNYVSQKSIENVEEREPILRS